MEDYQALAPAEGLVHRRPTLQLSSDEKLVLVNWAISQEYVLWLKLAEGIIEKAETAHFQTWKDKDTFERTGIMAVAQRIFFERLQHEVKSQVEELQGELEFAKIKKDELNTSPEELIQRGLKPE